jgi:4-hydroxyphenylacetate 3-monooxygenase
MRTGADYLRSLNDGRQVVIDGELVGSVAEHPAFAGVCRSIAGLYDTIAADPTMTFPSPATGEPVFIGHLIPRSAADLVRRRLGLTRMAEASYGLIGRGPEHVAGFIAGFASDPEYFRVSGRRFAENVSAFHAHIRDQHRYVAYTIVPPQIDRSKSGSEQAESHLQAGVVAEREDGIVIRGAQMLGTAAAIADDLFLSCIQPLKPEDQDYAISVAMPMNAPGLRLYARRGYAVGQPSVFDYPLSTRYDETDSIAVFHDVFVPWERVFVYRDVARARGQFMETPAHILGNSQAQIRLVAKTKFLAGLARKIAALNGIDKMPPVQGQLGEIASLVSIIEGMSLASEHTAVTNKNGVVHANPRFLYGAIGLQAELYPRIVHLLRELAGGGMLQVPSSRDEFRDPEMAADLARYVRSAQAPSQERVKLFKLAWDIVGSEFGGRHLQYEMFYAGAPFVAKTYAYHNYDFREAVALVDRCLAGYDLDSVAASAAKAARG